MSELASSRGPTGHSDVDGAAVAAMAEFEERNAVEGFELLGWRVWPLLRVLTSWDTLNLAAGRPVSARRRRGWFTRRVAATAADLLDGWRYRARDGVGDPAPDAKPADVVVFAPSSRRVPVGGTSRHRTADPLLDLVRERGHSGILWEEGPPGAARGTPSSLVTPRLRRQTAGLLPSVERSLPDNAPSWFTDFAKFWQRSFDHHPDWGRWRHAFAGLVAQSRMFEGWLRSVQPRAVVLDVWYNPTSMALAAAARRLGIPSVDLQHGRQGGTHFAYCGWVRQPAERFETVPDVAWTWGEADRLRWQRDRGPASEPRVLGNLWLNEWRDRPETFAAEHAAAEAATRGTGPSVLVTTQWTIDLADTVAAVAASPHDWRWLLRFHPLTKLSERRAWEARFRETGHPGVELDAANRLPLYALLAAADVHVTGFSSCALEALAFGVPTTLTHPTGHACYQEYVEDGVMVATTEAGLVERITETVADSDLRARCRAAAADVFAEPPQAVGALESLLGKDNAA